MSQDIVADGLNKIMNAIRAKKSTIVLYHHSKLLLNVLAIAKLKGYLKNYKVEKEKLTIEIENLHGCKAIKPRFVIQASEIEKYVKRYLPAKDIGILILSTSQGLITHHTALERNIGGSLIAYIY